MNWRRCGRKKSWSILKHFHKDARQNKNDIRAENRTHDLLSTSQCANLSKAVFRRTQHSFLNKEILWMKRPNIDKQPKYSAVYFVSFLVLFFLYFFLSFIIGIPYLLVCSSSGSSKCISISSCENYELISQLRVIFPEALPNNVTTPNRFEITVSVFPSDYT